MERDGEAVDLAAEAERLAAEFFDALQRLYIEAGEPPLRTVAARNPGQLSASNLSALFSGRRTTLPKFDVMAAAVSALLHGVPAAERQRELERWRKRWTDARYARKAAQKAASLAGEKAQADAELIRAEAEAEAERVQHEAEETAAQMRTEAEAVLAKARAEAEYLVNQGKAQAEQVLSEAQMAAAALRADAQLSLSEARVNVENMLNAAHAESERIRAEAAASVEAARLDAGNIRGDARMEARRILDAAEVVATVSQREQEIKAEYDRVLSSLNMPAAAGSAPEAAPQAREQPGRRLPPPLNAIPQRARRRPKATADEIAELERQDTRYDPKARLTAEQLHKMLERPAFPGEIDIV